MNILELLASNGFTLQIDDNVCHVEGDTLPPIIKGEEVVQDYSDISYHILDNLKQVKVYHGRHYFPNNKEGKKLLLSEYCYLRKLEVNILGVNKYCERVKSNCSTTTGKLFNTGYAFTGCDEADLKLWERK